MYTHMGFLNYTDVIVSNKLMLLELASIYF